MRGLPGPPKSWRGCNVKPNSNLMYFMVIIDTDQYFFWMRFPVCEGVRITSTPYFLSQTHAMYTPQHFEESRPEVLQQLVRNHPLCTLVTLSDDGIIANYIPMLLQPQHDAIGTLVGHVARANPVWRATHFEVPVLALFQGPQHYISPSLYATKSEHGKVVPTWNYAVVQARGRLVVHDDAHWVRQQVTELTRQQELSRPQPWAVSDAPQDYIDAMVKAIVGIEIQLTELHGKWKVSQNQVSANQNSVVQALQQGNADDQVMAELVRSFAPNR